MTLDEARLTLKELRFYPSLDDFDVEALNVAIKILEETILEEKNEENKSNS